MLVKAHRTVEGEYGLEIVPSHPQRDWMNGSTIPGPGHKTVGTGYANRCLPLLMGNQLGWDIRVTKSFIATSLPEGHMLLHFSERPAIHGVPQNNFNHSILTWPVPWLFETPPGWDMLILPPANRFLPLGVTCLTALVETDHAVAPFTLNWRIEPGLSVWFKAGDAIATLVPFYTGDTEPLELVEDTDVPAGVAEHTRRRAENNSKIRERGVVWEKVYWNAAKRRKIRRKGVI